MPKQLRDAVCSRIRNVNSMLEATVPRMRNTFLIDRRRCLASEDVQEFAHFSRRAVHAIATDIAQVLELAWASDSQSTGRSMSSLENDSKSIHAAPCSAFCDQLSSMWTEKGVLISGGSASLAHQIALSGAAFVFATDVSPMGIVCSQLVAAKEHLCEDKRVSVRRLFIQELPALMLEEPDAPDEIIESDQFDWTPADRLKLRQVGVIVCDFARCNASKELLVRCVLPILVDGRVLLLLLSSSSEGSVFEQLFTAAGCKVQACPTECSAYAITGASVSVIDTIVPPPSIFDKSDVCWVDSALNPDEFTKLQSLIQLLEPSTDIEANEVWVRSVLSVPFLGAQWLYSALARVLFQCSRAELSQSRPVFGTTVQYCKYPMGGHFNKWHCDESSDRSGYKVLGMVLFVSDLADFDGGEFQMRTSSNVESSSEVIESHRPRANTALIFGAKSLMHRVLPVTRGVRRTLVLWTCERDVTLQYEDCIDLSQLPSAS
jgi:hypothetical protein